MFACGSIHLSSWTLTVALVLLIVWILAALLTFFNVAMVLRTRRGGVFQLINLAVALGYIAWGIVLFCGWLENAMLIMVSVLLIPIGVFMHAGFLLDAERRFRIGGVQ